MKNETKKIKNEKTKIETKNVETKRVLKNDELIVNNEIVKIETHKNNLLKQLINAKNAKNISLCKSIRNKLRKQCKHYGALRNRTYVDKNTNERIVINK